MKAKTFSDGKVLVILQPWIPVKKPKRRDENIYKMSINGQTEATRYADKRTTPQIHAFWPLSR